MANPTSPIFKQIDVALAQYYQRLNVSNYINGNNIGLFLNYIKTEELDDPQLPIDEELGENSDPYNCAYTEIWINTGINFPIPPYAQIPSDTIEPFIFHILQYCYKYGESPSNDYIQTILVPKCNGTINTVLLFQENNENKLLTSKAPSLLKNYSVMYSIAEITTFVNVYIRRVCGDCIIHVDIVNIIQLYLFGYEGGKNCCACIPKDDSVISDSNCIAEPDNGERLSAESYYAMVYYDTVSKNKRDFCMEMKKYYKSSYGKIIKTFEDLARKSTVTDGHGILQSVYIKTKKNV